MQQNKQMESTAGVSACNKKDEDKEEAQVQEEQSPSLSLFLTSFKTSTDKAGAVDLNPDQELQRQIKEFTASCIHPDLLLDQTIILVLKRNKSICNSFGMRVATPGDDKLTYF